MFTKAPITQKSLAEPRQELEAATERLEAQKRSKEGPGGRGMPPYIADNLIKFYEKERAAIEEQVRQHPDYGKETPSHNLRSRRR